MSKRITLSDFEVEQIVSALTKLRNEPSLTYEVTQAGQRYYDQLIAKLKIEPSISRVSASSTDSSIPQPK